MGKKYFYEKQIRAELATFNPYLKKDIEQVRAALNIPKDGFSTAVDATKWHDEHYQTVKGKHPQGSSSLELAPAERTRGNDRFAFIFRETE